MNDWERLMSERAAGRQAVAWAAARCCRRGVQRSYAAVRPPRSEPISCLALTASIALTGSDQRRQPTRVGDHLGQEYSQLL